jgi:hypothetical protein
MVFVVFTIDDAHLLGGRGCNGWDKGQDEPLQYSNDLHSICRQATCIGLCHNFNIALTVDDAHLWGGGWGEGVDWVGQDEPVQ